jgi:hypothetical protein
MLYLFNSAFRPTYETNVLNTFFLDTGSVIEYRFRQRNVDPTITDVKTLSKKETLLVFIDRFHQQGFSFHPMRKATYLEHEILGDQVYFRVKVGDFAYPKVLESFQNSFVSTFKDRGLPSLPSSGPDSEAAGWFALIGEDISKNLDLLIGEPAWLPAVNGIARTRVFSGKSVLFLRGSIRLHGGKRKAVTPKVSGNRSYYALLPRQRYTLQLYYSFPLQDTNHDAAMVLRIQTPNLVAPLAATDVTIGARNSTEYMDFVIKDFPEQKDGAISLIAAPGINGQATDKPALVPSSAINIRVSEPAYYWPVVILGLLLYSLLGVCAGTDFDKLLAPLQTAKHLNYIQEAERDLLTFAQNNWLVLKGLATFFQALVLLWLFRMLGKKIS